MSFIKKYRLMLVVLVMVPITFSGIIHILSIFSK